MDIHRQQCQSCQSFDMRNILARQPSESTTVYVRCGNCGELVARYILSDYYHHGRGVESFLRSHGAAEVESGRRMLDEFKNVQTDAEDGYAQVLKYLEEQGKPI